MLILDPVYSTASTLHILDDFYLIFISYLSALSDHMVYINQTHTTHDSKTFSTAHISQTKTYPHSSADRKLEHQTEPRSELSISHTHIWTHWTSRFKQISLRTSQMLRFHTESCCARQSDPIKINKPHKTELLEENNLDEWKNRATGVCRLASC